MSSRMKALFCALRDHGTNHVLQRCSFCVHLLVLCRHTIGRLHQSPHADEGKVLPACYGLVYFGRQPAHVACLPSLSSSRGLEGPGGSLVPRLSRFPSRSAAPSAAIRAHPWPSWTCTCLSSEGRLIRKVGTGGYGFDTIGLYRLCCKLPYNVQVSTCADYEVLLSLDDQLRVAPGHQRESQSAMDISSLPTHIFKSQKHGTSSTGRLEGVAAEDCPQAEDCRQGTPTDESRGEDVTGRAAGAPIRGPGDEEREPCGKAEGHTAARSCVVCLDVFSDGDRLTTLPCIHQFHEDCINPYLRQKGSRAVCPVCKTPCFM